MIWRRRRVPFIPQLELVECGAAALAMVMAYHGREADLQEVREECGVSRDGASALDILNAAQRYGFDTEAVRASADDLDIVTLPAILHWNRKHFVVLESINEKSASILDPLVGPMTMPRDEVAKNFSNVALLISPTERVGRGGKTRSPLPGMLLAPIRSSLLQALLFSLLLQPFAIVLPVLTQVVVDRIATSGDMQLVAVIGAIIAIATAAKAVLSFGRSWVMQNVQAATDVRIMGTFVEHLLFLPIKFFFARRPGDLLYRMQSNAAVRELLAGTMITSAFDCFLILGYVTMLFLYDVRAALLIALFVVIRGTVIQTARMRNRRIIHSEIGATAMEGDTLAEAFAAFETVRATRSEERVVSRWSDRTVERWNWKSQRQLIDIGAESFLFFVEGMAVASLVLYAGLHVAAGQMTIGTFALLLMLQTLLRQPLDGLLVTAYHWQVVANHLARIDDVIRAAPEYAGGEQLELRGAIALDNVSFRYSPRAAWAVRDVTLHIAPGEKIAIAGRTGQGKSTIARLLLGLYPAEEGAIRFDGRDLGELDLAHLRRQIGVVVQESFLFNDTVAYNITLGDPDIDETTMREAARIACIDHVIRGLANGYDAVIGENGCLLSGGERQRLAIARAVARRPRILLLDEATSALDAATERQLHENLAALDCTRVVIAHRPQAIADADRIITIDGGRITAEETTELLEAAL